MPSPDDMPVRHLPVDGGGQRLTRSSDTDRNGTEADETATTVPRTAADSPAAGIAEPSPCTPSPVEELTSADVLPPPAIRAAAPLGEPPPRVRTWFDDAARATIPEHDGTIGNARLAAQAYARHAKADNTRRAYRAGVRAWCAWCDRHALPCLPGRSDDVVAFLAAERGRGLSVNTIDLRRAALRYLHFIAGCPVPCVIRCIAITDSVGS